MNLPASANRIPARSSCTELMSGPGLPTERLHARSDLKLPCYCSAAAKNRSACTELLFGPGLLTKTGAYPI